MRYWLMLIVLILVGGGGDEDNLKDVAPIANFVSATPPGAVSP